MSDTVSTRGLRTRPPFSDLYPIDPESREKITEHMRDHGFDGFEGLDVWLESDDIPTVVDGHTRLVVAKELGIDRVPVNRYAFRNQLQALEHALHKQRDRRNLTGWPLVNAIEVVDRERRRPVGGTGANQHTSAAALSRDNAAESGCRSSDETARIVGVSPATVTRARNVYDDPEAIEEVKSGVSIAAAAERARERKGSKRRGTKPPRPEATSIATNGNGHAPEALPGAATNWSDVVRKPRVDDEPWFKALNAGSIVESICVRAANEISAQLTALESSGFDLPGQAADYPGRATSAGKAVTAWKNADVAARALRLLVRRAVYGPKGSADEA